MDYIYHCQHQAESFARAVLPVPDDYPMREGLPKDFRPRFAKLCEWAKGVYTDMAKSPESYGLMLVDIHSNDHNLARDGYRTIYRFADTLSRLSQCGELKDHRLTVPAAAFNKAIRKSAGALSGPVPKYELILARLTDLGFVFSPFNGKPYDKNTEFFTAETPDDPEMIDTIVQYCACWDALKDDKSQAAYFSDGAHHHFYRFDYRLTSDCAAIPIREWLAADADYNGFSPELKAFSLAFYDCSPKYKGVKFDGKEYCAKGKRVARITSAGYGALGDHAFSLSLKLPEPDKYPDLIRALPKAAQEPFTRDCCNHCGFQGATDEYCKFRLQWTFDGVQHTGCGYQCFLFDVFDPALAPVYWKLLEAEYGLKKTDG